MQPIDLCTFAFACYARPEVEAACLQLQDQGADVCLLLCGAWLEARKTGYQPQRLAQLEELGEHWQREVVKPLRILRQAWKEPSREDRELDALRAQVKELELAAETILLRRLEALSQGWSAENRPATWLEAMSEGMQAGEAARATLRRATAAIQLELTGA
nr:TIGR02444 family protein [Pseudomonas sp.]